MSVPVTLLAVLLAGPARADVPPPAGQKSVSYEIVVDGLPTDGSSLVVYPWSSSNGAPTAELAVVGPQPLVFGRRISGSPAFHLLSADALTAAQGLDEAALQAWFAEADDAVACTGDAPSPQHEAPSSAPDTITDSYALTVTDGACSVAFVERVGGEASCGCSSASGTGSLAWLLGLVALVRRSR